MGVLKDDRNTIPWNDTVYDDDAIAMAWNNATILHPCRDREFGGSDRESQGVFGT